MISLLASFRLFMSHEFEKLDPAKESMHQTGKNENTNIVSLFFKRFGLIEFPDDFFVQAFQMI